MVLGGSGHLHHKLGGGKEKNEPRRTVEPSSAVPPVGHVEFSAFGLIGLPGPGLVGLILALGERHGALVVNLVAQPGAQVHDAGPGAQAADGEDGIDEEERADPRGGLDNNIGDSDSIGQSPRWRCPLLDIAAIYCMYGIW